MDQYMKLRTIIESEYPHINGIQVYQNNEAVFEMYSNHTTRETYHPVGCIFKSFISAAIGTALERALIESTDRNIMDYFPELPVADSRMEKIAIRHALTKTTGLGWPGPGAEMAVDTIRAAFSLELKAEPGSMFEYKPDPQLLVYLLERVTGMRFHEYIKAAVFGPLGIEAYYWDTSIAGIQDLKMPLYEVARLGQLYLAGGEWDGVRLIPAGYVKDSWTAHVEHGFPERAGYGYLWWISSIKEVPVYFAGGFGGQYLMVIPKRNMVVAIASQMDRPHPENKDLISHLL